MAPLPRGVPVRLKLTYEGRDVIQGSEGVYSVSARESWYPNLGAFDDLATYDMTFRYSARLQLIAVGEQVSDGHRLATMGARPTGADPPAEDATLDAALFAEQARAT